MNRIKSIIKSLFKGMAYSFPVIAFTDGVAYVAKVDGVSMVPTLNNFEIGDEDGSDFVLLCHWSVRDYEISRGQVVSIISPKDPNQKIIKRIIALEGDTVITRPNCKERKVVIPKGHCWVEGDHHSKSLDSNIFGPVSVGLITAHALCIVWPPKHWRKLDIHLPKDRAFHYKGDKGLIKLINASLDMSADDNVFIIEPIESI